MTKDIPTAERVDACKVLLWKTADMLMAHADELDRWAEHSKTSGWSTHQVDANRKAATAHREQASHLYREIGRF